MAKIPFSKLNAKLNQKVNTVSYNDCEIEVKEYLPITEKLDIISNIINDCLEENLNFYNPGKVEVYEVLYIIEAYTNISFTAKQKEERKRIYDIIISSGLAKTIISAISDEEINAIESLLIQALDNIYKYHNSAAGIIEQLNINQDTMGIELENVLSQIVDNPEAVTLLRNLNATLGK